MDKKRLKKTKDTPEENCTPKKCTDSAEMDELDFCGSPDFPNSQECFSIGWDWSGEIKGTSKPSIRIVERPKKKKTFELLECHRPRRLIKKDDSENNDDSAILEELKALAAGSKRVSEANSPVASSSSEERCTDVLITPTAVRNQAKNVSSLLDRVEPTKPNPAASETIEESLSTDSGVNVLSETENLNDLLDESIGTDLLKFTQDLELHYRQHDSKTPNPKDREMAGFSSSKKKSKLSLGAKKGCDVAHRSACRRINDLEENNPALSKLEVKGAKVDNSEVKTQHHGLLPRIEFDEFDEEALCSLGEDEKVLVNSKETSTKFPVSDNSGTKAKKQYTSDLNFDDDILVSPEILDIIDDAEKKATQDSSKNVLSLMDDIDIQHKRFLDRCKNEELLKENKEKSLLRKASSSLPSKCTAEEIEEKRLEAKKRLQLKKKKHLH